MAAQNNFDIVSVSLSKLWGSVCLAGVECLKAKLSPMEHIVQVLRKSSLCNTKEYNEHSVQRGTKRYVNLAKDPGKARQSS